MAYVSTVGGDIPQADAARPNSSVSSTIKFSLTDRLVLTLTVLAFGWNGRGRVVYRLAMEGIIVGALGAYQGGLALMAG